MGASHHVISRRQWWRRTLGGFAPEHLKIAIGCASVGCVLIAGGWAIAGNYVKPLTIAFLLGAFAAMAVTQRGLLIGLFVLAAMNGIPFIDTSKYIASKFTIEDTVVIVLLCTAFLWHLLDPGSHRMTRAAQIISRLAVVPFIWWVFTLGRTLNGQHVPLVHAVSFGREYLFFALLLAILPRVRLTIRDIWTILTVLVVGVCIFAVGQIMTALGVGQPGSLIHIERTLQQSGLTRVYAHMTDLVSASVAIGIAAVFLAPQKAVRRIAFPITGLLLVSIAVQQTRARWIGLIAGVVIVCIWLMVNGHAMVASRVRRRVAKSLWGLGLVAVATALATPALFSGTLGQRVSSIFTDLGSGGGSLSVRESVSKIMLGYLGAKWPLGIGFVPPSAHYFAHLPMGSIKDSDVGVLNAVMLVGAIGAVLLYMPVVFILIQSLRRSDARQPSEFVWLRYGAATCLAGALVSSVTLVTLFSTGGLVLTALVITLLAHPQVAAVRVARVSHARRWSPAVSASSHAVRVGS
jgi:hypothetical protein